MNLGLSLMGARSLTRCRTDLVKTRSPVTRKKDMETRKIRKVSNSTPTMEGAGVYLKRAFGFDEVPDFDPFLLFDDFRNNQPDRYQAGFPWHPHRGIETITYVLAGDVEHGDSLGNQGVIGSGDVQWMTAGGGIVHQEMPRGAADGRMYGFQLWANLPSGQKMMAPRYRDVRSDQIPEAVLPGGARIKVIAGQVGDSTGPVQDVVIDPEYLDVTLEPDSVFTHPTKPGHTVFAYVFDGQGSFGPPGDPETPDILGDGALILFDDGKRVDVRSSEAGVRFLLVSGRPLGEPVAWRGPIVMNTKEELDTAFAEYRDGTFLLHKEK